VCDVLDITPRTLYDWVVWSNQGGCASVAQHQRGGRGTPPRLTVEQCAELVAWIGTGLFHTIGEVRQWVQAEWGVLYTYWGMRSVLDRLKIHAKVPRPQAVTANPVAQEAWTKGGRPKRSRLSA
jgi:transposase